MVYFCQPHSNRIFYWSTFVNLFTQYKKPTRFYSSRQSPFSLYSYLHATFEGYQDIFFILNSHIIHQTKPHGIIKFCDGIFGCFQDFYKNQEFFLYPIVLFFQFIVSFLIYFHHWFYTAITYFKVIKKISLSILSSNTLFHTYSYLSLNFCSPSICYSTKNNLFKSYRDSKHT